MVHGARLVVRGQVTNHSDSEWPLLLDNGAELRVGAELHTSDDHKKIAVTRHRISAPVVYPGDTVRFELTLPTLPATVGSARLLVDLLYENLAWFHHMGGHPAVRFVTIAPSLSFQTIDSSLSADQPAFWQQHVPEYSASTEIGIASPRFQEYVVPTSVGGIRAKSMLTMDELALLYALSRYHYEGFGKIVDLGPLLGVGTNVMARGVTLNSGVADAQKAIYSYDLFLLDNMTHFLPASDGGETGSGFWRFQQINQDYRHVIVPVPGDVLKMRWTDGPIEVLFVDLAKSWTLNSYVLRTFFPHLVPGHSILIQQDYVHVGEPWVALTMELLEDYFERLYFIYGCSAVYRLVKPLPADVLKTDVEALPVLETDRLFERARAKAPATVAEVLKCCQAAVRIQKGELDGAAALISQVNPGTRDAAVPAQEFSRAIPANLAAVSRWLSHARRTRR